MARPLHGPAEPFRCIRCGRAGTGGTHKCVPYRAGHRRRRASDKPALYYTCNSGDAPTDCAAPRRGRGHARPVPHWQFWVHPDWCTRRVGNAFMRSETADLRRNPVRCANPHCRDGHGPSPTMAWRNHSGAPDVSGPVLTEHMNVFPTGLLLPSGYIRQTGPFAPANLGTPRRMHRTA